MAIVRKASAHWQGTIKEGRGTVSTQSGALSGQHYGFNTRFEEKAGTNPEELVGAAHAGCFAMAFSLALTEANLVATSIDVEAAVNLEKQAQGFAVTSVALTLRAEVEGLGEDKFQALAEATKASCPISKLLNANISLDATLVG